MTIQNCIDALAEESILLEPGNLKACGKMLNVLEEVHDPRIEEEKEALRGYLEAIIMRDLDGNAPSVETIAETVQEMQKKLRVDAPADEGDANGQTPAERAGSSADIAASGDGTDAVPDNDGEPAAETEPRQTRESPQPEAAEAKETAGAADEPAETIEDPELVRDFISESREHLEAIELNMVEWEKSPSDREIINSIFRPFHTIKGVAGFLNLMKINHLSHQLENLLDEARENRLELSPEVSDLIFDGVDLLKEMLIAIESAADGDGVISYTVDVGGFLSRLADVQAAASVVPEGDDADGGSESGGSPKIGEILQESGKINQQDIQSALERQKTGDSPEPLGEILIKDKKVSPRDLRDAIRKQAEATKPPAEKYIKVDMNKMDQLLNMVGELVIAQSMVSHNPEVENIADQRFLRDISQLSRVTSTLQNISMSMRLVPIGMTFQKMSRIVRDLARKSGKKINLEMDGQGAEIDRNMVEELYEPLVHMIRNSCDHGIQMPEERRSLGKPEEGTIVLKAEHVGGKIVITISDDGNGLNRDAILKKAREKGVIAPDEEPEDKVVDNLIFAPGFSTAKKITDVSGRGVGMDVVKKAIEKLHGSVEVKTHPGEGTVFTIKLPLTTAIIDGMLVNIGDDRYIIPTLTVRRLVHPSREDVNSVVDRGVTVKVRDRLLPLVDMHEVLRIDDNTHEPWDGVLVIVEDNGREIALRVDSVVGKQEVVIKTINSSFDRVRCVSGGAILGDGRVGLILDVRSILEEIGISVGA